MKILTIGIMFSLIAVTFFSDPLAAQYQLKPLQIVGSGQQAGNYQVRLLRPQGQQSAYLLAMSPHSDAGELIVRTLAGKVLLKSSCKQGNDIAIQGSIQIDNFWYYVDEKKGLLQIELEGSAVKQTPVQQFKHNDYFMLLEATMEGKRSLVASGYDGFDVYELPSMKCTHSMAASVRIQRAITDGNCIHNGDGIIYRDKGDKLQYYSTSSRRVIWSYATTAQDKSFLGIKLGVFDDFITYYTLNKAGDALYLSTMFGTLIKLNASTGKVIKKVDNFRGQDNNAGLITVFSLADINQDGVDDIIGTSIDNNVYAISGKDLSVIWAYNSGAENQGGVSLYDITHDGVPDVVTVNAARKLIVLDGAKGKLLCERQLEDDFKASQVILVDIDGNGTLDFVVNRGPTKIDVFEMPNVKVPPFSLVWDAVKW